MAAESAADVTHVIVEKLDFLSSTALTLFRALHQVAVEAVEARGYSPGVSEVVLFCPAEQVARAVGIHPSTLYRVLPELVEAGLVDARGHYTTLRGRTRADGTLWAVRLRPVGGRRARLGYGDLKARYRDLGGDIKAGRTSWATMRESKKLPRGQVNIDLIRAWALPPTDKTLVTSDSRTAARRSLEAVLDVPYAGREARSAAVTLAAEALAAALRDRAGVNFYRRLLWQLLRRSDATGEAPFHVVYEQARRAAADVAEGFGRRGGGLFTSRLKRASWYEAVMTGPPTRVGVRPVEA
jgi:DNA-binding transcriptional ArsR family regulator